MNRVGLTFTRTWCFSAVCAVQVGPWKLGVVTGGSLGHSRKASLPTLHNVSSFKRREGMKESGSKGGKDGEREGEKLGESGSFQED